MSTLRTIRKIFTAPEQSEGAGARVRRSIGSNHLRTLSPFLMLDHMNGATGQGFPDHPHRGQETVSYILKGSVEHEDFAGHRGVLHAGDLQFMTAGRGIMHSEQPIPAEDGSGGAGLQLWVDLPRHLKMCEPRYRDLKAKEIPLAQLDDGRVTVKVISGVSGGLDSVRDLTYTPIWYLDIQIQPGGEISQQIPQGWNAMAYVVEGSMQVSSSTEEDRNETRQFQAVVFGMEGDAVRMGVPDTATLAARILLIAGKPLDQPVVQHGPFVVTSSQEAKQALEDFYFHKNGFERAAGWKSRNTTKLERS
ncbi:RmlC-like cupin domain-containing protein [Colletotrichum godetiae]|uniref:RmlC-like cupin domain-containing protein n=1 Tax=Colletotrichum godetiae TaxID=1209918 RepID=A0AAJ0AUR4_9PEZI|nr:RmlC-like cupin domain-containing protein [Colletotrichum godetiae]KAK1690690.1 RmlC-like cupin domain-containing protein [Colletotrichum godetiae]